MVMVGGGRQAVLFVKACPPHPQIYLHTREISMLCKKGATAVSFFTDFSRDLFCSYCELKPDAPFYSQSRNCI